MMMMMNIGLNCVCPKHDCNTIALLRSSTLQLAAFWVEISLWEGMRCLQIYRRRKLALVFWENPSSLHELTGYVESTVFCEISPEHSLMDKEQKSVSEFFYFKICFAATSNTTHYANFFDSGTSEIYKKITNRHHFRDWCFVIKTAQLFCINDHIWYPINLMEIQLIVFALTAPAALGKQLAQQNIFYSLWGFPHFQRLLRFPKISKDNQTITKDFCHV